HPGARVARSPENHRPKDLRRILSPKPLTDQTPRTMTEDMETNEGPSTKDNHLVEPCRRHAELEQNLINASE
ncbi:hypothetical protein TNCT_648251, partial [Trichonephila clavata]